MSQDWNTFNRNLEFSDTLGSGPDVILSDASTLALPKIKILASDSAWRGCSPVVFHSTVVLKARGSSPHEIEILVT